MSVTQEALSVSAPEGGDLPEAGVAETAGDGSSTPAEAASPETPAPSEPSETESVDLPPTEQPAVEPTPVSFPSADEFGWDGWDGTSDALPEPVRPWGSRVSDYYQKQVDSRVQERVTEADRTRDLYEALLGGQEDPRVKEYMDKVSEWETKFNGLNEQHDTLANEYKSYQKEIHDSIQAEAVAYKEAFQKDNADIFSDENLATTFVSLLEEGWDIEAAAQAARMSPEVIQTARQYKLEGVPESHAIEFAQKARGTAQTPRPGARITSGATTAARSPEQAPLDESNTMSFDQLRKHVAKKAINSKRR